MSQLRPVTSNRRSEPSPKLPQPSIKNFDSIYAVPDHQEDDIRTHYVIGAGTPAEILREGELSKELLRLYFDHFCDINFLFDRDRLLREFDMGEVSQVILYSMMALGIRCVCSEPIRL